MCIPITMFTIVIDFQIKSINLQLHDLQNVYNINKIVGLIRL